jgi:hypothetical protein
VGCLGKKLGKKLRKKLVGRARVRGGEGRGGVGKVMIISGACIRFSAQQSRYRHVTGLREATSHDRDIS